MVVNNDVGSLTKEMILDLWTSVGWKDRLNNCLDQVFNVFKNSTKVYLAWEEGKLLGLISLLSDGYNVCITFCCVNGGTHSKGVGTSLMNELLKDFPNHRVFVHTRNACSFYKKFGFKEEMHGMQKVG